MAFRFSLASLTRASQTHAMSADDPRANGFLPYLCSGMAVFGLVIVGELIAVVLVLMANPLSAFSWEKLAYISMIVQWIILLSAAVLCGLSARLALLSPALAGMAAYLSVLCIAAMVVAGAQWLMEEEVTWSELLKYMLLAAIISGIFLRYLYLQQQLRRQQQAELQSRIQALHARIRPHFLFNALNAAASLIPVRPELAEQVIEDLSEIFRTSLQQPSLVPLQDELDLCRRYTTIEQIRLGDRLAVEWDLPDNLPATAVPSFLLQPLIENAIYHGVQRLADGGLVEISAAINDAQITLKVSNPVPELPASQMDQLVPEQDRSNNHMALENITHRLQAHYGDKAVVNAGLVDEPQHRYHVEVILPLAYE